MKKYLKKLFRNLDKCVEKRAPLIMKNYPKFTRMRFGHAVTATKW